MKIKQQNKSNVLFVLFCTQFFQVTLMMWNDGKNDKRHHQLY